MNEEVKLPEIADEAKRLVAAIQSMRARMMGPLTEKFGDAFDGDFDTMFDAVNFLHKVRRLATPEQPDCRCVDCGGDQPRHDPTCSYMRDLVGEQPGSSASRPFAWYRPTADGDQEPEFRTTAPPAGHGWLPVPGSAVQGDAVAWLIEFADGSVGWTLTDEEADDAIAEAHDGATKRPLYTTPPPAPTAEPLCGCGRPAEYEATLGGWACNKYARCKPAANHIVDANEKVVAAAEQGHSSICAHGNLPADRCARCAAFGAAQPEARGVEGRIAEDVMFGWRLARSKVAEKDARSIAERMQRQAATPNPVRAEQPVGCNDSTCGCKTPAFTAPIEALRFLSARFKYAGVGEAVAKTYARDIDAILAEQPEAQGAWKLVPVELVENTLSVLNEAVPLVVIDSNGMRSEYQDEQATEALRVRLIEARNALASAPAAPGAAVGVDDTKRLDWLEANEFDLVTRREDMGEDEYAIWWFVVDSRKSTKQHLHTVSGHPLGSPREAIDAALAGMDGAK